MGQQASDEAAKYRDSDQAVGCFLRKTSPSEQLQELPPCLNCYITRCLRQVGGDIFTIITSQQTFQRLVGHIFKWCGSHIRTPYKKWLIGLLVYWISMSCYNRATVHTQHLIQTAKNKTAQLYGPSSVSKVTRFDLFRD